jgi:hypothetical protein
MPWPIVPAPSTAIVSTGNGKTFVFGDKSLKAGIFFDLSLIIDLPAEERKELIARKLHAARQKQHGRDGRFDYIRRKLYTISIRSNVISQADLASAKELRKGI